jgi:Zn-dependent protease with chaperone function
MTAGLGALQGISQAATGSLVAAVWQGIALAAAVGLALRLLPKTPAALRFAIWFAVFVVVAGLPVLALWPHAVRAGGRAWLTLDARWSLAIASVWALASLGRAVTLMIAGFRVRALWRRAVPVEIDWASSLHPTHRDEAAMDGAPGPRDGAPRRWLRGIVRERQVRICSSDEVDLPSVIGFFAPKILIPRWLLEKLTAAELQQIVLHEAGHLRRADDWLNLAQKIALVVFPLNPALAWVERRLCFERELACDERVLRACGRGAAKAYAACLAALAEHRLVRQGVALSLGALGHESELGRRVGEILGGGKRMRAAHARLVLGGAVLGLVASAAGLSRCPRVVGFSEVGSAGTAVASGSQAGLADRPEYRAVGLKATNIYGHNNDLQQRSKVSHEILLAAAIPSLNGRYGDKILCRGLKPEAMRGSMPGLKPGPISGTRAAVDGLGVRASLAAQRQPTLRDKTAKDGPPNEVAGWVVVATWEGADGSRLVLTTFDASNPPNAWSPLTTRPAVREAPAAIDDQAQPSQVHPYAAVPTRDGWLVIQL